MKTLSRAAALALAMAALPAAAVAATPAVAAAASPQAAVDELLAADRAFAAAAAKRNVIDGLTAMFAEDVWMPTAAGSFARSPAAAAEVLGSNPANRTAQVEWAPVRGGISADGSHGFTFGFITTKEAGKPDRPGKYLAYWVKKPDGWRVAAYKRVPRPEGATSPASLAPALPAKLVRATGSATAHAASLKAAEDSFGAEAQKIGLGPAFAKWGRADAVNIYQGGATIEQGAERIGRNQGTDATSSVNWGADAGVLVAPSGDLGVTFGYLRANGPVPEGRPTVSPFFTVWRRNSVNDPWRYIAE
ncbi:DUF4440 domain-containing protein [Sphingoaurantiacus capsulatus]|uniref:DUF4440 domain-containing protein n=1 Tax=Sphingoaurantiacus capsulatus TaxID=1771310 RepID=A0ABV7XFX6_9SPHN